MFYVVFVLSLFIHFQNAKVQSNLTITNILWTDYPYKADGYKNAVMKCEMNTGGKLAVVYPKLYLEVSEMLNQTFNRIEINGIGKCN